MPHLVIQHSANLQTPIAPLCNALRNGIASFVDGQGNKPFPIAGTRVLAYAALNASVADGSPANAFVYLNLRVAKGRPSTVLAALGETLSSLCTQHFAIELTARPIGITLQIDEGVEVFNAKMGNLHARLGRSGQTTP
jgi:5-carboxymethyl-2-hydroxymuconate isomerase